MIDFNLDFADVSMEAIVSDAENKAKRFAREDGVKTNQIRNFFTAIAKMRTTYTSAGTKEKTEEQKKKAKYEAIRNDLILLKPKLAYAAGRKKDVRNFSVFLTKAIDAVIKSRDKTKAIENFFALIESIVAYHKYHGGKDS